MSSKNLKVYRTEFVTEVGEMNFKVKFACQVKIIWKRSDESAETTLVPVENGVVKFNQTLKLKANMYFDPSTNKFVEKKCQYSFLIITEKGEKSAGKITFDMGGFLNKRQYEANQEFVLQKCPLPDTKIKLKIYYNESTESGSDTMSQISAIDNNLDISTASMDLSEIVPNNNDAKSEESNYDTTEKSKSEKKEEETQSNYDPLNESDLGDKILGEEQSNTNNEKMNENIQALNNISGKISDFVSKCSGNIKNEIENLKMKNNSLEESLSVQKFEKEKLQKKLEDLREETTKKQAQFNSYKLEKSAQISKEKEKSQQLSEKLEQSKKMCSQLESSLSENGESQGSYIEQLKQIQLKNEEKLNSKIEDLEQRLLEQKKQKSTLNDKIKSLENKYSQLGEKYSESKEKCELLTRKEEKRQAQIEELRGKMENVYESLVGSLGSILK